MLSGLSSLIVASTLAFHPFSPPMAVRAPEPVPDPSWDEPAETPEGTEPTDGTPPVGDPADAVAPAPTTTPPPVLPLPPPMIVTRPAPPSGLGLMIGAGVTGGLAWLTVFARLAAINRCKTAVGEAVTGMESGWGAANACFRSSGTLVSMTPLGWILNDVTYGLAPAAGAYRGKYDGVKAAWDGGPNRPTPVFVGVGAGLLAAGVVGRIATVVAFWRQFGSLDRVFSNYPLSAHFVLAQLSAASIQAGGGLLAYGLAYKKMRTNEESRRKAAGLAELELAPQLGWAYSGVALQGRF